MRKEKLEELKTYLEELKTIKFSKIDKDSHFLNIETFDCYLNNGHKITREKILKGQKDGSAVIILPMTEKGEFLLAIEPRVFTDKTVDVGLPAGYIEENEDATEAAKRELFEETGYEADNIISLGSFYQDQGCSGACNYYFLATNCKKVDKQHLDESEFIKYILVNYEELKWLLENNYIRGLNSAYLIEKVKTYIKGKDESYV